MMADWQPLYLIKFREEHKDEGVATIFRAGTVVWTKEPGVYRVDKKCLEALEKKRISFTRLNSPKSSENQL
jgi:hypothetical protein